MLCVFIVLRSLYIIILRFLLVCIFLLYFVFVFFFFSSRRRHTRSTRDWSSDVCSSDLSWSKPILIAPDLCVLHERQLRCQRLTPGAHACDLERLARDLVQGDAAEVDRQVLFEAVNGDPEDAVQILALADRAGDLLE